MNTISSNTDYDSMVFLIPTPYRAAGFRPVKGCDIINPKSLYDWMTAGASGPYPKDAFPKVCLTIAKEIHAENTRNRAGNIVIEIIINSIKQQMKSMTARFRKSLVKIKGKFYFFT